jgi:hypothetical protein
MADYLYQQTALRKSSVNLLARGDLNKLYNDVNAVLIREQQKKNATTF